MNRQLFVSKRVGVPEYFRWKRNHRECSVLLLSRNCGGETPASAFAELLYSFRKSSNSVIPEKSLTRDGS
jgi:hypothetical protein